MTTDINVSPAADVDAAPEFHAPYAPPDAAIAVGLLGAVTRAVDAERRIDAYATRLIEGIRARAGGLGGIEDFLHAYSLSTKEGLALMVLAEALLRVPDAATTDRLIEDKLATGDWSSHDVKSSALIVSASAWTLGITARIIHPGETPDTILESLIKRLGLPAVRAATRQAMRLLASHFVLGQTIEEALARAGTHRGLRYSFDMLGEAARTGGRRRALFRLLCRRHRCHRRQRRRQRAARSPRHFGQALRARCALRGDIAGSRARRIGAEGARARPQGARA